MFSCVCAMPSQWNHSLLLACVTFVQAWTNIMCLHVSKLAIASWSQFSNTNQTCCITFAWITSWLVQWYTVWLGILVKSCSQSTNGQAEQNIITGAQVTQPHKHSDRKSAWGNHSSQPSHKLANQVEWLVWYTFMKCFSFKQSGQHFHWFHGGRWWQWR